MWRVLLVLLTAATVTAQQPSLFKAVSKAAEALIQSERANWPTYQLKAGQSWLLNWSNSQRFDASGLLLLTNGDLLTLSDRGPSFYRIQFRTNSSIADLRQIPNLFTPAQLKKYAREKFGYYDSEGMAQDDQGRFYVCEEANRWILRCNPGDPEAERLEIDWAPVKKFFSSDRNASFEGITVLGDKLFVANERNNAVIIVVNLKTLKVLSSFQVFPKKPSFLGTHYSDLSRCDGKLYVLCRQHRVILEVDPDTHQVLAEFDYGDIEGELGYETRYPVGIMEGLAVTRETFWLATDNNGLPRLKEPNDIRPTLLKLQRPDAPHNAVPTASR